MPKGKEITVSNVTDKEYYRLSQAAYNYKMLALHMKYKTPYKISKTSYWYVEKVKQDSDTGLDAFVFSKGIKSKTENGQNQKPRKRGRRLCGNRYRKRPDQ